MGIFRPLVERAQENGPRNFDQNGFEPSDNLLTIPTAISITRPILAVKAAGMLLRGESGVTPVVGKMVATDMEGVVGRLIDRYFPDSGLGSSKMGVEIDLGADTSSILVVGIAAMFAPRMPKLGRAAIGTALGHEGFKVAWAIAKNNSYQNLTGERLEMQQPTLKGKESMVEKFGAILLAVGASDLNNPVARTVLASSAMGLATAGTFRAEGQRRIYDGIVNERMAAAALVSSSGAL